MRSGISISDIKDSIAFSQNNLYSLEPKIFLTVLASGLKEQIPLLVHNLKLDPASIQELLKSLEHRIQNLDHTLA